VLPLKAQDVRLGRPPVLPAEVVSRIVSARGIGVSWSAIGRALDTDGVPTAQGGARWYPATVRAVYLAAAVEAAQASVPLTNRLQLRAAMRAPPVLGLRDGPVGGDGLAQRVDRGIR